MPDISDILGGALGYIRGAMGLAEERAARGAGGDAWSRYAEKALGDLPEAGRGGGQSRFPSIAGHGGPSGFPSLAGYGQASSLPPLAGGTGLGDRSLFGIAQSAGQAAANLWAPADRETQPGQNTGPGSSPQPGPAPLSGPSAGMPPGVARWAAQTQATFGDLMDADVMLAIMTNESGGDPDVQNHQGHPAYGLFQLWEQPGLSVEQQFAAARKLAQDKMAGINAAYARNGLNPDARTRARDFALAWAGHFDYATGQPNPNSRDVGAGQTAAELSAIFLANYDRIKAGRQQQAPAPTGGAGGMASIWGGRDVPITQPYGVVTPGIDQAIYGYGREYGGPGGHTGLDIGLRRGDQFWMPAGLTGVVEIAGGSGYFRDEDYGDPGNQLGRGELRIRLANGDLIIFGHNSQINVAAGQQVTGGQLLGLVGSANGDHLHLEVRRALPGGGYQLVDPAEYFGYGGPVGQHAPGDGHIH